MGNYCYVYGIVQRAVQIPSELRGLAGTALSTVDWRDLEAVISPIESATLPIIPACLLPHEAVVEALCRIGPTLPVRFGTILADSTAVAQAIAGKYGVLLADMARVGDKVEIGLTILWDTTAGPDGTQAEQQVSFAAAKPASSRPGNGTRYLEARLAQYRRETMQHNQARTAIAHLEQVFGPYLLEQRYRVLSSPRLSVRAAYLVHPRHIQDFKHIIDQMRHKQPEVHWLLSGPWPPYTFVTGAGELFQQGSGLKNDGIEAGGGRV
jgi:hypothetical protein